MNYFKILDKDFSLESINSRMLLKSNIIDFNNRSKCNFIEDILIKNKNKNNTISNNTISNTPNKIDKVNKVNKDKESIKYKANICDSNYKNLFHPKEKDTLFWCYYINKYGVDNFLNNKRRNFTIEHEFKINTIEKMQSIKDILKLHKIKKILVEDQLMNENRIGIDTIKAFMVIDNTNVIIVKKYCYQVILIDKDREEINNENYTVIFSDGNTFYVNTKLTDKELLELINMRHRVDDLTKPLKSISSYKLSDIQCIADRLKIELLNSNGKNKTKQILYTDILEKIVC